MMPQQAAETAVRRFIERFKSVVLALLVVLSLLLSVLLWGTMPSSGTAPVPRSYVLPGNQSDMRWQTWITPLWGNLVLDGEVRRMTEFQAENDTWEPGYRIWQELLEQVQPHILEEKDPLKILGPVLQEERAAFPVQLHLEMTALLPWSNWQELLAPTATVPASGKQESSDSNPRVQQFRLLRNPDESTWQLALFGEGALWSTNAARLELPTLDEWVDAPHLWLQLPRMIPPPAVEGLTFADEVWVPAASPRLGRVRVAPEVLDQDRMVRSFFGDLSVIRRADGVDGSSYFTDGLQVLGLDEQNGLEYTRIHLEGAEVFSLPTALQEASRFVGSHGGWPSEFSWQLWALEFVREPGNLELAAQAETALSSTAVRFDMTPLMDGVPVFGGKPLQRQGMDLEALPSLIQLLVANGTTYGYTRMIAQPIAVEPPQPLVSVGEALESVARILESEQALPAHIMRVAPAYRASATGDSWEPGWLIEISRRSRMFIPNGLMPSEYSDSSAGGSSS